MSTPSSAKGVGSISVNFINGTGTVTRTKSREKCCTIGTFLMQVAAAHLTESVNSQFVLAARLENYEILSRESRS